MANDHLLSSSENMANKMPINRKQPEQRGQTGPVEPGRVTRECRATEQAKLLLGAPDNDGTKLIAYEQWL